jgi:ABC-2 type transport system permease protein
MTLTRLMIRRHRVLITSWPVLLVALTGVTVSAYQSTYPTPQQRRVAVDLAQHNAATTLLYGNLPNPGAPAQMFAWEIGAIATILAAIIAVLVAVALTRAAEDNGTLELVRSCGADPRAQMRSAFAILALVAAILTLGCAVAAGVNAGRVDAVTWPGAAAFGSVVGLTFLLVAVITVVLAQIVPTAGGARTLGFAAVGAAFGIRSFADTQHIGWLDWLSPLGLRATVRPFTGNHWWVLAAYTIATAALAWLATVLLDRREYRAGLIRQRDRRESHLNIHSSLGLAARLARQPVLTWMIAVAGIGTLFSAMGSGVVKQSQGGDVGGFLGTQLGAGDPIAGYFAYSATVVGMVASSFAVLSVLKGRHDETGGLTDHVLAAGTRRWAPLAAQVTVTALGTAAILVATGALSALVAPFVIDGTDVAARAFGYIVGQWPAAMAMAGWTALLVGRWPRLSWLAWIPLVASATLALLGQLLGVPRTVRDLGIFQHVPDIAVSNPNLQGLLVLLACATATILLGVAGITRRDIITG